MNGADYKIGDTIYYQHVFSEREDKRWNQAKIIDQTSRSWIIDCWPHKLPKSGKVTNNNYRYASEAKALEDSWDEKHRSKIVDAIKYGDGVSTAMLRKIAELIGYKEETGAKP